MVKDVSIETQRKLVPELDSALRKGAGFNTRAAVADAVASLCSTCPAAFQIKTSGSTMSNPTVRLFRALYFASEIKGFDCIDNFSRTINIQSLKSQLTFMYIPEPDTLFTEIQKLKPGVLYKFDNKNVEERILFKKILFKGL